MVKKAIVKKSVDKTTSKKSSDKMTSKPSSEFPSEACKKFFLNGNKIAGILLIIMSSLLFYRVEFALKYFYNIIMLILAIWLIMKQ
jgi:hypothetical protein